jgi:hypothetical protein
VAFVAATAGRGAAAATAGRGAASRGAASRGGARRKPANLNDLPPGEVDAELQRRRQVAAIRKQRRDQGLSEGETEDEHQAKQAAAATAAAGERPVFRLEAPDAVGAGSGAVLTVLAWFVALNYIEGGIPQVKRLIRAKFFNKID